MLIRTDESEFERIKAAKRGTVRFERGDDYVIIAHCSTLRYIGGNGPIEFSKWYVSVHYNGLAIKFTDFNSFLTYDALEAFIVATIATHQKG